MAEIVGELDKPVEALVHVLNKIPGVETSSSCCGHGERPFYIWLSVTSLKALRFMGWVLDRRYGGTSIPQSGFLTSFWALEVANIDVLSIFAKPNLEEAFMSLNSRDAVGETVYLEAHKLVEDIEYYLAEQTIWTDRKEYTCK